MKKIQQTSAYTQKKSNQNNNENVYGKNNFHRIDFIILHDEQQKSILKVNISENCFFITKFHFPKHMSEYMLKNK